MRRFLLPLVLCLLAAAPAALADDGKAPPTTKKPAKKKVLAKKKGKALEPKAAAATKALIKTSMGDIEVELWPKVAPKTVEIFLGLAEGKGTFTDIRDPKNQITISKPFFDGLGFHRVISGFMLQGGCPRGNGTGDAGFMYADEINAKKLGLDKIKILSKGRPHQYLGVRSQADWQRNVLLPVLKSMKINHMDVAAQKKREPEIKLKLETMTIKELYEIQGYKYNDTLESVPPMKYNLALANAGANTNSSQFFINLADTPWLTGKHTVFGKVTKGQEIVDKIGTVKVASGAKPVEPVKILSIRKIK